MPRPRLVLFFVFAGIITAAYQITSMLEVPEDVAAELASALKDEFEGLDGQGIFFHNTMLALPMFLPGAGALWGGISAAATGFAYASLAQAMPELRQLPALALLYLTPFGLMELAAYSLATSRSYMLARAMVKNSGILVQAKPTAIEIGIVVGLLLAGGLVEHHMIYSMEEGIVCWYTDIC